MRESAFSLKDLQNASVAVLGFGRAGRAVTDYLLSHGCVPTVYAAGGVPEAQKGNYPHNGVSFCDKFPEEFAEDVLFRSPGIRPDHAAIRRAVAKGATLTGEVDWFLSHTRARVIGVTGSDGKTTTANLITALLREAGHRAVLGGNNGDALLPHLDTLLAEDFAVVELSSFQLMTAPAPDVAVLTNLTPNHLNWHTDFWEYAAAKCRILAGCSRFVTDAECAHSRAVGARTRVPVAWCACAPPLPITPKAGDVFLHTAGDELVLSDGEKEVRMPAFAAYRLPGAHNRKDLLLAYGAVYPFVDTGALVRVAQTFRGVAHRMQTVGCVSGVTYIDSSIDTSPTRTAATLAALACAPIVIAGGRGKGIPLRPLADALARHAKCVVLYGETAEEIEKELNGRVRSHRTVEFARAFALAATLAGAGDTVVLSPGCTAYDQFDNFEKRGECFCHLVEALAEERR